MNSAKSKPVEKIIIDCDPGVDDALALAISLATPRLEVVSVTTVFGNLGVGQVTRNACGLLALAGESRIPVAKGTACALNGQFSGGIPHVHGYDGLGDQGLVHATGYPQVSSLPAAGQIVELAKKFEPDGGITIVALGPLTNLAIALQLDPEIDTRLRRIVLMGGNAFCVGNATPAAEANILCDPEAADLVFGARWPITMVGLDVTHKVFLSRNQISRIAEKDTFAGIVARKAVPFYEEFLKRTNGIDGIFCHDPSAIAFLLRPELFETVQVPVRVETQGISRGKTWPSLGNTDDANPEPWRDRVSMEVCRDVDGAGASKLIESLLTVQSRQLVE